MEPSLGLSELPFERKFCPCGFEGWEFTVWSAEWHRRHKKQHLLAFPNIAADRGTVRNLDEAITRAESLEGPNRDY